MAESRFLIARKQFHALLLDGTLTRDAGGCPSNADRGSRISVSIANRILDQLGSVNTNVKLAGQTAGANFEDLCAKFVTDTFASLHHLRPGKFMVEKGRSIALFDQYTHLKEIGEALRRDRFLATAIGNDYLIKPDVIIARVPEDDRSINNSEYLVDENVAKLASIRLSNQPHPILHASLSCKWTIRSDRGQNARSEGLNLVRNRKGRLPHIAVITGEPLPTRIASLALGTGDIDCVYHFALDELRMALSEPGSEDRLELVETMIAGKRLRDIADLPLDLIT